MYRAVIWLILLLPIFTLLACRPETQEPAGPVAPMVLDYHFAGEPLTLDPALATDRASLDVMVHLFEGLTAFNPETVLAEPALAVDWDVSEDGLTYTFKMKENALWVNQQGEPQREVTAEDVTYGIKRACNPAVVAPLKELLFVIKGCQEVSITQGVPDLDRVAVRAIDRFAVEFTLESPAAYLPAILAMPVARPVPQEMIEQYGEGWTEQGILLSNGPYLLSNWVPGEQLTLEKNPYYYDAASVAIVRVNGHFIQDPEEALRLYQAHQLDALSLASEDIKRLLPTESSRSELTLVPTACTYSYGFTLVKPPVDNARVRRALSLAIDRQWLVGEVLGDGELPASHFVPRTVFGALPDTMLGVTFDLDMARRLMAEAGYPEGQGFPPITILHPTGERHSQIATAVAAMWKQGLNIDVIVQAQERPTYLESIKVTTPLSDIPQVWMLGWCAELPDAHEWLYRIFHIEGLTPDEIPSALPEEEQITVWRGSNNTRRTPNRFDGLTAQAIAEREPAQRLELYAEAEELLLLEEAVLAPLYHPTTATLSKPWLTRTFFLITGQSFKGWTLDMVAKEQTLHPPQEGQER
ncbi:MAG: peptide ABC transporter substrate-binding protein [Ardenticatenales bacterium]|nr:peptide ABC transporter substrate-binding protein [Ardenticatenales bacterium]